MLLTPDAFLRPGMLRQAEAGPKKPLSRQFWLAAAAEQSQEASQMASRPAAAGLARVAPSLVDQHASSILSHQIRARCDIFRVGGHD